MKTLKSNKDYYELESRERLKIIEGLYEIRFPMKDRHCSYAKKGKELEKYLIKKTKQDAIAKDLKKKENKVNF